MVNKQMFQLGHCTGMTMNRETMLVVMKPNESIHNLIMNSNSQNFVALRGDTQVPDFMLVLLALNKKFGDLEPIAKGPDVAIVGIK